MEIRDILHGSIGIRAHERAIVDSRFFQRLREIKQLGFAENSFPSATHNRYIHSLGAMHTASNALEGIFKNSAIPIKTEARERFDALLRLAALLHDVGHGPLAYYRIRDGRGFKPGRPGAPRSKPRKATHEDYTLKIVLDSSLTPLLERAGRDFGFGPEHIASLIDGARTSTDDFFEESIEGSRINFRPLLATRSQASWMRTA